MSVYTFIPPIPGLQSVDFRIENTVIYTFDSEKNYLQFGAKINRWTKIGCLSYPAHVNAYIENPFTKEQEAFYTFDSLAKISFFIFEFEFYTPEEPYLFHERVHQFNTLYLEPTQLERSSIALRTNDVFWSSGRNLQGA